MGESSIEKATNEYLDQPAWKGSVTESVQVALVTILGLAVIFAGIVASAGGSLLIRIPLVVVWGLFVMRSFIVFHDCGHGSFIQGFPNAALFNKMFHEIFAVLCGTPDEWAKAHSLHHQNVGNIGQDDYDWGETIFMTKRQYLALPKWKRILVKATRFPPVFFVVAPVLVWWVSYRIPFSPRPGRKGNYSLQSKAVSTFFFVARYYCAYKLGILAEIMSGDWFGMMMGIMLFHCQHAYNDGYVRSPATGWNRFDASVEGSSCLVLPGWLKFFTVGIEYHHIHHHRIRIPGYKLKECHEKADPALWKNVAVLEGAAIWETLWNTVYDDDTDKYSTFAAAEQSVKDK